MQNSLHCGMLSHELHALLQTSLFALVGGLRGWLGVAQRFEPEHNAATSCATSNFRFSVSANRSSKVPLEVRVWTVTGKVCPMRCARSVALTRCKYIPARSKTQ
eukprot:4034565-Amphidinium_carterae.1